MNLPILRNKRDAYNHLFQFPLFYLEFLYFRQLFAALIYRFSIIIHYECKFPFLFFVHT